MGCEDLHTYNAPSGPMIFAGCVEKMIDQFVSLFHCLSRLMCIDLVSSDYGTEYESRGVLSGTVLCF